MEDILVPLGFFGMVAAIVIIPSYLRSRERQNLQDVIRAAIERGQPLPKEVLDVMTRNVKPQASRFSDIRVGVIWLAIGVAIAASSYFWHFEVDDFDAQYPAFGVAAIPAVIGLTYIALSFFNPNRDSARRKSDPIAAVPFEPRSADTDQV